MSFIPISFLQGSNIYEVNLRQYTREGSIPAFRKHLPRLRNMGIDILWFMPLTPIAVKERKGTLGSYYAAADYYSINPEFGQDTDFKDLVSYAHELGFKVIIDWVANHAGWDHVWTKTHPEYFRQNEAGSFYERNGWEDVIDLNYDSETLRVAMISAMQYWVTEFDIDGFRCDMAMLVPLDFWIEARTQLDQSKPLIWLAECEDPAYLESFDLMYGWEWMHLTATAHRRQQIKYSLQELTYKYQSYASHHKKLCLFTSNHDENSWNGTEFERYGDAAWMFAALTMVFPNIIPLIYSGQELPLKKRLKFFDKDEIEWTPDKPALEEFYTIFLKLRKRNPYFGLYHQKAEINTLVNHPHVFSVHVGQSGKQDLIGLFNLSYEEINFELLENNLSGTYKNIITNNVFDAATDYLMQLNPFDFRIYENTGD